MEPFVGQMSRSDEVDPPAKRPCLEEGSDDDFSLSDLQDMELAGQTVSGSDELESPQCVQEGNKDYFNLSSDLEGLPTDEVFSEYSTPASEAEGRGVLEYGLPVEVWHRVFSYCSMSDLKAARLVCRLWWDIIDDISFRSYTKLYSEYKCSSLCAVKLVESFLTAFRVSSKNCLLVMARCVAAFQRQQLSRNVQEKLIAVLEGLPHFQAATFFMQQHLQDSCRNSHWPVFALMAFMSESVDEITQLMNVLKSLVDVENAIEFFYCLALFFLMYERKRFIGPRHHYQVFYALHHFSQTRPSSDLTSEQQRIVVDDVKAGELIKVVAFAGTGKTHTLEKMVKFWPNKRFLYVCYTKQVRERANDRHHGTNTDCRTLSSLAHGRYPASDSRKLPGVFNIMQMFKLERCTADCVLSTLKEFLASDDTELKLSHVPVYVPPMTVDEEEQRAHTGHSRTARANVLTMAQQLWHKVKKPCNDASSSSYGLVSFDVSVKLYQLAQQVKPSIVDENGRPYDCILLDECQDCTPAYVDVVLQQRPHSGIVIVGDPNQCIFKFRGAYADFRRVYADRTYYLTQSFRFGPKIAYISSLLLQSLGGEQKQTLVGLNNVQDCTDGRQVAGQVAILARRNRTLLMAAIHLLGTKSYDASTSQRVFVFGQQSFTGDIKKYISLDGVRLGHYRSKGNRSWSQEKELAKREQDDFRLLDLLFVENLARVAYPGSIKNLLNLVTERLWRHQELADIILSTVHKAKGLDFENVILADDFDKEERAGQLSLYRDDRLDEGNILYVAVSRARRSLVLNETVLHLLEKYGHESFHNLHFLSPESKLDNIDGGETPVVCGADEQCNESEDRPAFVAQAEQICGRYVSRNGTIMRHVLQDSGTLLCAKHSYAWKTVFPDDGGCIANCARQIGEKKLSEILLLP